ncbi:MAG: hypothetical protein ACK55T_08265 [Bacteroidota bacterium]|jgi:hypothetical protein
MKIAVVFFIFNLLSCKEAESNDTLVNKFINDTLTGKYVIRAGKVIKYISLYKNDSCVINYKYNTSNNLIDVLISDKSNICGTYKELEQKEYNDNQVQQLLLKEDFKIQFPLPQINRDELASITYILSSVDNYIDTTIDNQRQIIADNINMSYRFNHSELESFITTENVVSRFVITLLNNVITKEEIFFDRGVLARTYSWQSPNTLIVKINCVYDNNEHAELVKKFILYTKAP